MPGVRESRVCVCSLSVIGHLRRLLAAALQFSCQCVLCLLAAFVLYVPHAAAALRLRSAPQVLHSLLQSVVLVVIMASLSFGYRVLFCLTLVSKALALPSASAVDAKQIRNS